MDHRLAAPRLHTRRSAAEPLEDRLVLSAAPVGLAPFASADGVAEASGAFIGVPDPAPASTADSTVKTFYVGTYVDVNKHGGNDSNLCWAAATSNVLAYTNWGFAVSVSGETPALRRFNFDSDLFNCFIGNFTDLGSLPRYGIPWFISGNYTPNGWDTWAQVKGDGGGYYPGISGNSVFSFLDSGELRFGLASAMAGYLERGYGVTVGVGWYSAQAPNERTGGHEMTVWGYTYDDTLAPTDPNYYTGLIITDSDDGYTGTKTISIDWNSTYNMYRFTGYGGGTGWIESFTCLKPVKVLTGVRADGYNGPYDGQPHTVTVSGIDPSGPDSYTVTYWQNGIQLIDAPSYTAQGTRTVTVTVVKNNCEAVWSAPVTIKISEPAPKELAAPKISNVASAGRNTQRVTWNSVAGAEKYELAWSADGGVTWTSRTADTPERIAAGLPYGGTVTYRVRALGDDIHTAASAWSAERALPVNPSDIDGDGFIGPGDFALISAAWFASGGEENYDPRLDIDGDGFIGPGDSAYLSANWFKSADDDQTRYPS